MRRLTIRSKRQPRPQPAEFSLMIAMPTPLGWGDKPRPAHGGRNMHRLERGEIRFDRLHIRIFPDKPILPAPVEDKVKGTLGADVSRRVLPTVEQSPYPEPPVPRRQPVSREIMDYAEAGDSDAIRDDLLLQIRTLNFRLICEAVVAVFLGFMEILPHLGVTLPDMFLPEKAPAIYLTLNLVLVGFCVVLCRGVIAGGFSSLVRLRPDGEGMLTLATIATGVQILFEFIFYFVRHEAVHRVCGAPLVTAMLLGDAGLLVLTRRVARNFSFVALHGMRISAKLMDNDTRFDEITHVNGKQRESVAYGVRTKFLSNYLRYAYEEDLCEQLTSRITPFVLPFAALCGVLGGIVSAKDWGVWGGVYCACAALTAGIPACRLLCLNLPMDMTAQRLLPRGAMLNGWAGADEFGLTEALAVSSDALFPQGTVQLLSAKAFGEAPIDRSVLYAAAVITAAGGPLAQVFDDMLGGERERLPRAEDIEYETEMGISGYVEGYTVLVGNRELLRLHGCPIPSRDYEGMLREGKNRSLVYIAIGGVPCAVMLVRYTTDDRTAAAVQRMVENGVDLVVYTCDPNVTRELISGLYHIPKRHIAMLSTRAGSEYDRLTHTILDEAPAVLATGGKLSSLADALTAARRLRSLMVFTTIIQMVCYTLCLMLVVLLCCISGSSAVDPAQLLMMQLICAAATIVSLMRRVI